MTKKTQKQSANKESTDVGFPRDENGYGALTVFEHFIIPEEELAPGAVVNGFEINIVTLVADPAATDIAKSWIDGDNNISNWNPSKPEGDGWVLSAICEHEEGPFAVFAKPAGEVELTGKAYAQEFLLGALINAATKHLKTLSVPWIDLKENEQKRALAKVHDDCRIAVRDAIDIIASNARLTFVATVDQVVFKDGVKAVLTLAKTPEAHSLADAEGSYVTIVIEERSKLLDAGNSMEVMPDQKPLFDQSSDAKLMESAA